MWQCFGYISNEPLDEEQVEHLLLDAIVDEFEAEIDDGSSYNITQNIVRIWKSSLRSRCGGDRKIGLCSALSASRRPPRQRLNSLHWHNFSSFVNTAGTQYMRTPLQMCFGGLPSCVLCCLVRTFTFSRTISSSVPRNPSVQRFSKLLLYLKSASCVQNRCSGAHGRVRHQPLHSQQVIS
jgi:hypothetical protein